MPFVTAGRENSAAIRIYYEDHGSGPPVVLVPSISSAAPGSATRHGSILPYEATGGRLPALLSNVRSTIIAGGPHAIIWTHADEVNQALLDFTRMAQSA
jgi:non-heme chloroperoxidase